MLVFQEFLNIQSGEWIRLQKEEKVSSNMSISSKCWLTDAGWHWEVSSNTSPAIRENGLDRNGEETLLWRDTVCRNTVSSTPANMLAAEQMCSAQLELKRGEYRDAVHIHLPPLFFFWSWPAAQQWHEPIGSFNLVSPIWLTSSLLAWLTTLVTLVLPRAVEWHGIAWFLKCENLNYFGEAKMPPISHISNKT